MLKRIFRVFLVTVCFLLASIAIAAILARCWDAWFIDVIRMGWVGFVFARLVALILLVLALRRFWRSFPRLGALTTGFVVLALAAFCVLKSYSPDGVFGFVGEIEPSNDSPYSPELYHKDHFWRISDGKVQDCYGDKCGSSAQYKKTRDGWVIVAENGHDFWSKLQFSVFGFRLVNDKGLKTDFYPRRIIPFARPYWMPHWLQ